MMVAISAASVFALALGLVAQSEGASTEFNGSVSTREQMTLPSEDSFFSTADTPMLFSLNEINLRGKALLLDERLRIGGDVSAFVPFGGIFADADPNTRALRDVDDHPVPARDPFIALSEYWVSAEPVDHLVLTVGKKRLTWGPGFAFSPTDLFNPPRDPTDPSLQRAGFLHARIDLPFETFTLTALAAPAVLETVQSIPTQVAFDSDDDAHYATALRAYALVLDTDINAWLTFSNEYGDDLPNEQRIAFTLSKNLFITHAFHAEVLLQQGSARGYPDPDCVKSLLTLALCARPGNEILEEKLADSDRILPRVLLGWRWMPEDGSMLVLEYLYQADGYLRAEYDDVTRLFAFAGEAQRRVGARPEDLFSASSSSSSSGEVPNRFAFDARRRHYLFFSYTKPQVLDDFTLTGTIITPVEDLSMLMSGSVAWQAQEWLQISLLGFAPLPSPARASADLDGDPWESIYVGIDPEWRGWWPRGAVVDGIPYGEFDGAAFRARVMLEARAFF